MCFDNVVKWLLQDCIVDQEIFLNLDVSSELLQQFEHHLGKSDTPAVYDLPQLETFDLSLLLKIFNE